MWVPQSWFLPVIVTFSMERWQGKKSGKFPKIPTEIRPWGIFFNPGSPRVLGSNFDAESKFFGFRSIRAIGGEKNLVFEIEAKSAADDYKLVLWSDVYFRIATLSQKNFASIIFLSDAIRRFRNQKCMDGISKKLSRFFSKKKFLPGLQTYSPGCADYICCDNFWFFFDGRKN